MDMSGHVNGGNIIQQAILNKFLRTLVIGIFIWAIDFAVSGAVTAVNKAASETTEVVTTTDAAKGDENDEDTSDKADDAEEESTEATTTA